MNDSRPSGAPTTPTARQARAWVEGRLEQVCARCGLEEAAGDYCSACGAQSTRRDWHEAESGSRATRRPTSRSARRA